MNKVMKDLFWTAAVSAGLGAFLVAVLNHLSLPFPLEPEKRPVFIVGIILFSLVFRLLMHVREASK
jgi:hypothetical protein